MPLPTVEEVRRRIDMMQREDMRVLLKSIFLLGAARISEMVGVVSPGDSSRANPEMVYGPRGTDVTVTQFQVEELTATVAVQIARGSLTLEEALPKVDVALFRVKIAKRHLERDEEPPSRLVALPLDKRYEPWTQEIYEFFKKAGNEYVFPFTRWDAWKWVTKREPVFKGLTYPVEKYSIGKKGEVVKTVLAHDHVFKLHGLRHVRNKNLFENYHFDGLDFAAYVGWSIRTARSLDQNIPAQMPRYASIYENWPRYFPKLLRRQIA